MLLVFHWQLAFQDHLQLTVFKWRESVLWEWKRNDGNCSKKIRFFVFFVFVFPSRADPGWYPPWGQDGIADNDSSSWRMDLGWLYPVTATIYWNMLTSIKGEGKSTASFDSVLKMDQLAQNNRSDGCLGFLVDWPFGFPGTMTRYA